MRCDRSAGRCLIEFYFCCIGNGPLGLQFAVKFDHPFPIPIEPQVESVVGFFHTTVWSVLTSLVIQFKTAVKKPNLTLNGNKTDCIRPIDKDL